MDKKIRSFEIEFLRSLRSINSSFLDAIFQGITILGEKYVLIALLAVIYFIYDKKIGQTIAYSLFTSLAINNTIKGLVQYPRPFVVDESLDSVRKETATGFAFPSGHTQQAATLYPSIAYNCRFKNKKMIWIIAITIVILVGFSRLFLAVHYPKDVIVGLLLGLGCTFICPYLYKKCNGEFKKEIILFLITIGIFTPFVFIFYKSDYEEIRLFRDFYLCYALFAGYIASYVIDYKFTNYSCNTTTRKKLFRFGGAIVGFALIEFGLKFLFQAIVPAGSIFLDMIRYFLISFVVLGIYPLLFKKTLFKD